MRRHVAIVVLMLVVAGALSARASNPPEFGTVQLPQGMTIEVRRSLAGTGQPAVLPPGSYTLHQWSLSRTDAEGHQWKCEGTVPESGRVLAVSKEQEAKLPVGEPLVSTLQAVRRGPEFTFTYSLEGRLGEKVSLWKDGKQGLDARLRIRNADGSYDQTFTFAYT